MIPNKKLKHNISKEPSKCFNESVDDFQGQTVFREAKRIKLKPDSQLMKSSRAKLSGIPGASSANRKVAPMHIKNAITAELLLDLQSAACADDEKICPSCKSIVSKPQFSTHLTLCLKSFHRSIHASAIDGGRIDTATGDASKKNCELKSSDKKVDDTKVLPCPVCSKALSTTSQRISHLKKCAIEYGLSSERLLVALRLQEKQAEERASLGLPTGAAATALKINEKKRKREKTSSEIDLACALSLSMVEKETGEIQNEEDRLVAMGLSGVVLQNRRDRPPLRPSEDMEVKFGKVKRAPKKKVAKVTSILRSRTNEERENILSEKLATFLLGEKGAERIQATPIRHSSYLSSLISKECPTWEMSSSSDKNLQDYYVSELEKYIEPKFIEVGSMLKHFSQIPGRLNFTQIGKDLEDDRDTMDDCSDDPEKTIADLYSTQLALAELLGSQEFLSCTSDDGPTFDTHGSSELTKTPPALGPPFSIKRPATPSSGEAQHNLSGGTPSPAVKSKLVGLKSPLNAHLNFETHHLLPGGSTETVSGIPASKVLVTGLPSSRITAVEQSGPIPDDIPSSPRTRVPTNVLQSSEVEMLSPSKPENNHNSKVVSVYETNAMAVPNTVMPEVKSTIASKQCCLDSGKFNDETKSKSIHLDVAVDPKVLLGEMPSNDPTILAGSGIRDPPLTVMQTNFICDWTRLLTGGVHSDVTIRTADGEISAHALVLRARCPPLWAEVEASPSNDRVWWSSVEYETAFLFLAYLYTGQCSLECEIDSEGLLALAEKYRCTDLVNLLQNKSPRKAIIPRESIPEEERVTACTSDFRRAMSSSPDIFGDSLTNGNPVMEACLNTGSTVDQKLPTGTTRSDSLSKVDTLEHCVQMEVTAAAELDTFVTPRKGGSLLSQRSISSVPCCSDRQARRKLYLDSSQESMGVECPKARCSVVVDLTSNSSDSSCSDDGRDGTDTSVADQLLLSMHNKSRKAPNQFSGREPIVAGKTPYKASPEKCNRFQAATAYAKGSAGLSYLGKSPSAAAADLMVASNDLGDDYVTNVWDDFDDGAVCGFQEITPAKHRSVALQNVGEPVATNRCNAMSPIKGRDNGTPGAKAVGSKTRTNLAVEDDIGDETLLNAVLMAEDSSSVAGPSHRMEVPHGTAKGFATPKHLFKPGDEITPMLEYKTMVTPQLKKELDKYGIRKLSRNKAIKLLVHIYDEMHPLASDSESSFCNTPLNDRKQKALDPESPTKTTYEMESPDKDTADFLNSSQSSMTSSSSMGDDGEFETSIFGMKEEDDEQISLTQTQSLTDKISAFIKGDSELYKKILQYDPIWINELQSSLKAAGIKCSKKNLIDYLDEQCITFRFKQNSSRYHKWKK